jgi:putative ABC transport system permease protein
VIDDSETRADLTPPFPGLDGVENCRDWEPGIPIDLSLIRQKDEDYWDRYGAAPKAFIRFDRAQAMWGSRYGQLTAVRYTDVSAEELARAVMSRLDPESLGIRFREVRRQGLAASGQGVDFSQLFIGFSFFLLIASLLLTSLLFLFMMEQRTAERALLMAVGFSRRQVRFVALAEGLLLAAAGAFCGSFLAAAYNLAVLRGLETVWQGAVGVSSLTLHIRPATVMAGMMVSTVAAGATMALVIWRQSTLSLAELQRLPSQHAPRGKRSRPLMLSGISAALAFAASVLLLALSAAAGERSSAASFFLAGALLLVSGLILCRMLFVVWSRGPRRRRADVLGNLGTGGLAVRNIGRNRGRSLLIAALLASGIFVVIAVGANRRVSRFGSRDSGTGGFAYYAETDLPVFYDLEEEEGREKAGLTAASLEGAAEKPFADFVGFRVLEGDDASCLNLNRTENPPLLGVDPRELSERKAFRFAAMEDWVDPMDPWSALNADLGRHVIPAVADQTVITWGLGKSIGDTLAYLDERGRRMEVRLVGGLANSIFQGNLIISEAAFQDRFPSVSGKRVFLVDAHNGAPPETNSPPPDDSSDLLSAQIQRSLRDYGVELTSTVRRLSEFNKVENTYLSIFLVLGGLGLLLGSLGLGIVVLRNIQEKRSELALMRAAGFRRGWLWRMVIVQHGILVAAGILVGGIAGFAAALPALMARASDVPYDFLAILLIGLAVNGLFWIAWSGFAALRGDLIPALRNE